MLWNESARVVDPHDFRLYDWADWSELRRDRGRAVHPGGSAAAARAGGDHADRLRPAADARPWLQPAQCVQAGPLHLPVLQCAAGHRGTVDRPRHSAVARRHLDLGELRAGVRGVQQCKADRTPQQAGMKLRRPPVRPTWKPLYAAHRVRIASWAKFISEAYWNVELES